jgi:hypothetical protein
MPGSKQTPPSLSLCQQVDLIKPGMIWCPLLIGVHGPHAGAAVLRKQLIEFCDTRLDNESLP